MHHRTLTRKRVKQLLSTVASTRVVVVGDVMLDHFVWGTVGRISPEAPVPVVEVDHESFMPGGAGNVARNLTAMEAGVELFGLVGQDTTGRQLRGLLSEQGIGCAGLLAHPGRPTSVKTRVVAHTQQVVRIDREQRDGLEERFTRRLLSGIETALPSASAVVVCDYGKGVVTQPVLDALKSLCRRAGVWLSFDPKPVHRLNLTGLSLVTPNRKETFELAGMVDETRIAKPLEDVNLIRAAERLLGELRPAVLLITLGELGMLLCQRDQRPFHIPTVAKEVFDVSGAGDTVISYFTLGIAMGASPLEAATLANHAAGIVVGKVGTATVTAEELLASFPK